MVSSLAIEKKGLDRYTHELDHAIVSSTKLLLMIMPPFAFTQSVEYCFLALGFWFVQFRLILLFHSDVSDMAPE